MTPAVYIELLLFVLAGDLGASRLQVSAKSRRSRSTREPSHYKWLARRFASPRFAPKRHIPTKCHPNETPVLSQGSQNRTAMERRGTRGPSHWRQSETGVCVAQRSDETSSTCISP